MSELNNRLNKLNLFKKSFLKNYCPKITLNASCKSLISDFKDFDREQLIDQYAKTTFQIQGRISSIRSQGKAVFIDIQHEHYNLQCFFKSAFLNNPDLFKAVPLLDIGDALYVEGAIMRTKKGELTLKVQDFALMAKALNILFDKHHGLKDTEIRYRQRYIDFLANKNAFWTMETRIKTLNLFYKYLTDKGFLFVDTPILHHVLGGANAFPFETEHNALNQKFYLRVAPELYLKRLIVAGFHKICEIGRLFRNEGIDSSHNPEFTAIEIYEAFSNMEKMMDLTEDLLQYIVQEIKGNLKFQHQNIELDFSKFDKFTMVEALQKFAKIDFSKNFSLEEALELANKHHVKCMPHQKQFYKIMVLLYEQLVEPNLIQPTFIYRFPKVVSPLAQECIDNNQFTERFELIINGDEYANAFSELTDPFEQEARFKMQLEEKAQGNLEACELDHDYIEALKCGLVPTGGLGIGVDRFIMLLTNQRNIKEILFFPTLKNK